MPRITTLINRAAHKMGFEICRFPRPLVPVETEMQKKRRNLLQRQEISVVLDVGGNRGTYGQEIRDYDYRGLILSFEPLSQAFQMLTSAAYHDPDWKCLPVALGAQNETSEIHIAGNLDSSSFLPMGARHLHAAPFTAYRDTETVTIKTLDSLRDELQIAGRCLWLKLDVQGYELNVLRGAELSLTDVQVVETELSYVSLYDGQPLFSEMYDYLNDRGFDLVFTENTLTDWETGHVLQVDALFVRRSDKTSQNQAAQ